MQPIEKKLVPAMGWQQEPIRKKLALEFFVTFIYATATVSLFHQPLYSFHNSSPPLKRLV